MASGIGRDRPVLGAGGGDRRGQTVAAVAKAHNVPLQTVIGALVADGTSELAAEVAKGTITRAQADAQKPEILQRATDLANGSSSGGRPGLEDPIRQGWRNPPGQPAR